MEKQPSRTNLIPFSLLSTSVFERSKKVSSSSTALPVSYPTGAVPKTLTNGPASQVPIRQPQDEPHSPSQGTVSNLTNQPMTFYINVCVDHFTNFVAVVVFFLIKNRSPQHQRIGFAELDPFVQGQSRRGRQLYERSNQRTPEDRGSDDAQRPSNKRRIQSESPEPRKRPVGPIGAERQSRLTKSAVVELSPISPVTSPLARSFAIMSPLSSSSEADDVRRNHRNQHHHHSALNQRSSSHARSGRSPKRSRGSQKQGHRSSSSKSRVSKRKRARDSSDSSPDSTSSDSDTDSDSEDFDRESHVPGSALRLHGVIHDLMLEVTIRTKFH